MGSNELLNRIETLREKLKNKVKYKGYTDVETVHISQQLDDVLNIYNDRSLRSFNESRQENHTSSTEHHTSNDTK